MNCFKVTNIRVYKPKLNIEKKRYLFLELFARDNDDFSVLHLWNIKAA